MTTVAEVRRLAFDHDRIVKLAVQRLRSEYQDVPDPRELLEEPFTLLEPQRLREAVFGRDSPKDSFRRGMQPKLREVGRVQAGQSASRRGCSSVPEADVGLVSEVS